MVGVRGKFSHQARAFARVGSAIHATNVWLTPTINRGATEFSVEVAGSVFVVGEQQHLLALEFACQELFKAGKLGIAHGGDGGDIVPDFTQSFGIASQIVVQSLEVVE
jgi:hypothetical protein